MRRLVALVGTVLALAAPAGASCRIDATADRLIRTATVPAFGNFTILFWGHRLVDGGDNETMFSEVNTGSGSAIGNYVAGAGTDNPGIVSTGPTINAAGSGSAWTTGTWRRIAMTFDDAGNSIKLYEGDADPTTALTNTSTITDSGSFVVDQIGFPFHNLIGGTFFSGRIGNIKLYTAVLTTAQMKTELQYFNVQDATNVWGAWTCKTETATITDTTGNGRSLTGTGLTSEADPPITDAPSGATPKGMLLGVGP